MQEFGVDPSLLSVALGALCAATAIFPRETFLAVIRRALRQKSALVAANEEAFARGAKAIAGEVACPEGVVS